MSLSQKLCPYRKGYGLYPARGSGGFPAIPPGSGKENQLSVLLRWNVSSHPFRKSIDLQGLPGVRVTLRIPLGAEIARKTLNPKVGVEGGLSVLGTTGFVEPWDDHLEESMRERVAISRKAVLTTGRIGLRYARLLYPDHDIVLVGGKIGEALDAAQGKVILFGLPALILRYINPHILDGTGYTTVEEYAASPAFHRSMNLSLRKFKKEYPQVRVVIVNRNGVIIGESP